MLYSKKRGYFFVQKCLICFAYTKVAQVLLLTFMLYAVFQNQVFVVHASLYFRVVV